MSWIDVCKKLVCQYFTYVIFLLFILGILHNSIDVYFKKMYNKNIKNL